MQSEAVGRPMEILCVEDSLMSARLTMGALRNGNIQHRMTWLTDGQEALDFVFRRGKYTRAPRADLILLDLSLPKKDGREVLQEIKSDEDLKRIPVVILTASTDSEDMVQSERLQVDGYLTKPVDVSEFLDLVKKLERFWHADMILPSA